MTLIELLAVIAIITILAALLLPVLQRARPKVHQAGCVSNLRQVGIAFRNWADDHSESFPMQVPAANGGTREAAAHGLLLPHFYAVRKELGSAKILVCPADPGRTKCGEFGPRLHYTNVSYFVGLDAVWSAPSAFLSGDRNLQTGGRPLGRGVFLLTTNASVGWTASNHVARGNVLLADGAVQPVANAVLRSAVQKQGIPVNRLAIP